MIVNHGYSSREYFDNEGKQMIFAIREGSDKSVLWKAVVEIACIKIDPQANKVESYRSLSLVKLMKVFYTLKNQDAAKDQRYRVKFFYIK